MVHVLKNLTYSNLFYTYYEVVKHRIDKYKMINIK